MRAGPVVVDGCRGVELHPGDVKAALQEMAEAGVDMVGSAGVQAQRDKN